MNPALLAVLINEIAIPELTNWLRSRHAAGTSITDADVLQKLLQDTNLGVQIGEQWLAAHTAAGTSSVPITPPPIPGLTGV